MTNYSYGHDLNILFYLIESYTDTILKKIPNIIDLVFSKKGTEEYFY